MEDPAGHLESRRADLGGIAGSVPDGRAVFDPNRPLEELLERVPARWAVYWMLDQAGRPVQLLVVRNLRASLKRRLGEAAPEAPSRKIDYRQLVRQIHWRRVDSDFEADWVYLEQARRLFPGTYKALMGFSPAWFVHIDPQARFPRYVKTIDLSRQEGVYLGPLQDKHAAARFIEQVEDWFNLCRYYNILLESPKARACVYKEMGRCPAPCDGSISLDQYRQLIAYSLESLTHPAELIRQQTQRMRDAAAETRYELAGRIKHHLDSLAKLTQVYRHVRPVREFNYLSLQRGPRTGMAKVFLVTPARIGPLAGVIGRPQRPGELLRLAWEGIAEPARIQTDESAEGISLASHHLYAPKAKSGALLHLDHLNEAGLLRALDDLWKGRELTPAQPQDEQDEGLTRELEAL